MSFAARKWAFASDKWRSPLIFGYENQTGALVGIQKPIIGYDRLYATGATHEVNSPFDLVAKHEYKADKWAIERALSVVELDDAVAEGHTEIWDLAEYFCVTEDFMRKVVCWYTYGNLATELYF